MKQYIASDTTIGGFLTHFSPLPPSPPHPLPLPPEPVHEKITQQNKLFFNELVLTGNKRTANWDFGDGEGYWVLSSFLIRGFGHKMIIYQHDHILNCE